MPFNDTPSFVAWMQATHKAPFYGPSSVTDQRKVVEAVAKQLADPRDAEIRDRILRTPEQFGNIKVNTDLNPYPKAVTGLAINPADGSNFVVSGGGPFYVTRTDGRTWTGDYAPRLPVTHEHDTNAYTTSVAQVLGSETVGISIDRSGTTYSALNVADSSVIDGNANTFDFFSQVAVAVAHDHGLTPDNQPRIIASSDCQSDQRCDAVVQTKGIVTDHSGTASDGNTYIYYTYFCNSDPNIGCPNGMDFGDSVMVVQAITGNSDFYFNSLFGNKTGDASVVIDGHGQPNIFDVSYETKPNLTVSLDTNDGGYPIASFAQADYGLPVIQCDARGETAYCVFQTTQVGIGAPQTSNNVYLATVNLTTAATTISRVNNDPLGKGKQHFDPHVAVTPSGAIYVGWFDNRQDPASASLNYFVGKSSDGGKTFPIQKPINDRPFNPTPYAYTALSSSIAAGPDGSVHAVWTDTRDGVSPQIWSQTLRF